MNRVVAALLIATLGFFGTACAVPEDTDSKAGSESQKDGKGGSDGKDMTSGQENALQAGQNYVDTMPFSKAGLIQQLSSPAGDGYSKADATFAANNVDADWKAEAVEAAENYMDTMPMSKDQLIQQLSSSAGDKFTKAEATYAANQVY
jgi:hypothetical protein